MVSSTGSTHVRVLGRIILERLDNSGLLPRVQVRYRNFSQLVIVPVCIWQDYSITLTSPFAGLRLMHPPLQIHMQGADKVFIDQLKIEPLRVEIDRPPNASSRGAPHARR